MPGTLYVVATPIGNLEDTTLRALRVLREVALIAAEDTRTTRKLLSRSEIHTPLTSLHQHSDPAKIAALVERLLAGQDLAVVSEAGTPGISDPGEALVRAAVEAGVTVSPVPGPSALTAALSVSGLPVARFIFEGFPPRTRAERRRRFAALAGDPRAVVFYESPRRAAATLAELRETLGDRPAVVARELTKKFEEVRRGTLGSLAEALAAEPPRGEVVLVVAGAEETTAQPSAADLDALAAELLAEGVSPSDAARRLAAELGVPRRAAYAAALRARDSLSHRQDAKNAKRRV